MTKIIFCVFGFFCLFKWYKLFEYGESGDRSTCPSEVISQLFDLDAKKYINMLGSV